MGIILIVEDQRQNQTLYADIVEHVEKELKLYIPCLLASTFEQAQQVLEEGLEKPEKSPVLILLDMELPYQGHKDRNAGYRLMENYRDKFPTACWVPLTMIVRWHEEEKPGENPLFEKLYKLRPFRVFSREGYDRKSSSGLKEIVRAALKKEIPEKQERATLSQAIPFSGGLYVMSEYGLYDEIRSAAESKEHILLYGEHGSAKQTTARFICDMSDRREKPFLTVEGNMDVALLKKLLFPLDPRKKDPDDQALLNQADQGTLYIADFDRMGGREQEQSKDLQRDLWHYLTYLDYDVRIIGGIDKRRQDISAFDIIFQELLEDTIALDLTSLNERKADIPILVEVFLEEFNRGRQEPKKFTDPPKIYKLLRSQNWQKGNISRLRSVLKEVLLKTHEPEVTPDNLREVLETTMDPVFFDAVQEPIENGGTREIKTTRRPFRISDEELHKFGIR